MVNYELMYPGTSYLLDPEYNFQGYHVPAGEFGGTTSIQTANQLGEVNKLLNQGVNVSELSLVNPEVFEMMTKEQLNEIARLNKLTGAESTIHAPVIDPSGFTDQGWNEENRQAVERQFSEYAKRAHELNPKGNIPVTIHASQYIPGSTIIPEQEKGKGPVLGRMIAVDQETGQPTALERGFRYYPGKEGKIYTPEEELEITNNSYWDNKLSNIVFYKERANEILREHYPSIAGLDQSKRESWSPEQKSSLQNVQNAYIYLQQTQQVLNSLYNEAYKFGDEKARERLREASQEYIKQSKIKPTREDSLGISFHSGAIQNLIQNMQEITDSNMAERGGWKVPEKYVPIEDFAVKKASETLSNVALNSYKQFRDSSPIISIENPPYGAALSSGSDLKKLVEETRKKFVEKLVKQGSSESEAKKISEKMIGATWDTSHISMIRRQGFGPEQVVKETKEIAPFVKHVHFNDNFGSTHTDLPPGMGNLPIADIMKEFEKAGFKGKKVFEGGQFFQQYQTSPFPYQLAYSASPMYLTAGPGWNQAGGFAGYYSGYGTINPPAHHSIYGAGFTTLPVSLGGEMPSPEKGRFAQAA